MEDPLFAVSGRVAIVTGATGGIGSMIARGLVERGVRTYLVGRDAGKVSAAAEALSPLGFCRAIVGDVSTTQGRAAVARLFGEQEPALHILVNNAGALTIATFDEVEESDWDAEYDINVKAAFFLAQALIDPIRLAATAERPATIINIGSIAGMRIRPRENYAYQSSKAALHHLTRGMAHHFGPQNITVNAIAPGTFPSGIMLLRSGGDPDPQVEAFLQTVPRRRFGEPDDIAGTVLFLASRAAAYVTGTIVSVDGGLGI